MTSQRNPITAPQHGSGMQDGKMPIQATPEAVTVILLDEIAGKLGEMQAQGLPYDADLEVTSALQIVDIPFPLLSVNIWNDGPNLVFFAFNEQSVELRGGLGNGETIGYNAQRPWLTRFRIRCSPGGTAAVRLKGFA